MTGKCTEKNLPNSVPAKLGEGLKGRRACYSILHYERIIKNGHVPTQWKHKALGKGNISHMLLCIPE